MEKIIGIVEEIIFQNEQNGYTVMGVSTQEGDITCVGTMFKLSVGEEITVEGTYSNHAVYGKQLNVEHFSTAVPKDKHAFEKYLGSGAIKGIGPVLAGKIVEAFEEDTFRIIEEEPERLEEVKGISMQKAQIIAEKFYEQRSMRQAMLFLQEYQISLTYGMKIYECYKEKTYQIIRENPYRLSEDIYGIGFKLADDIAQRMGMDANNPHRIMSALLYVLNQATLDGHVYLEKGSLLERTQELLNISLEQIDREIKALQLKHSIHVEEHKGDVAVYLSQYYTMEEACAHKICQCLNHKVQPIDNVEKRIASIEMSQNIVLDKVQKEAILDGVQSSFFVLTGGPGTGKTTTINTLIQIFRSEDLIVLLAAPTGRAAKRMTEATGHEASTIHRLLEINYMSEGQRQAFERNEDYPLECDVLIVDEISMLDIHLLFHLLRAIPLGCRVVFVGDKDQLPSVGAGNVLRDLVDVQMVIPTAKLQKIYRQAEKSAIVSNAHKIHQGVMIEYKNKDDFFFIQRQQSQQILQEIISLVKTRLPKFTGLDYQENIQVLTPMRKGMLGVEQLNVELQKALNPPSSNRAEKQFRQTIFREGDKVMQIRNNYHMEWTIKSQFDIVIDEGVGIFNGDLGVIKRINHHAETVCVVFDDLKEVNYGYAQLEELELAYSMTIHKSQGSEYPIVIIPLFKGPTMLLSRNLLYTAVTRARQLVVLVGDVDVLQYMIDNNREINRNSTLSKRIMEVVDFIGLKELK